mgnify:CR=1 FL=1
MDNNPRGFNSTHLLVPMQTKITKKFINTTGEVSLEILVEGRDEKESIGKSLFLTEPDICSNCQSQDIVWRYQKAKEYTFIKRVCKKCNYESNLGEFKDGNGYFWKPWTKGFQRNQEE